MELELGYEAIALALGGVLTKGVEEGYGIVQVDSGTGRLDTVEVIRVLLA